MADSRTPETSSDPAKPATHSVAPDPDLLTGSALLKVAIVVMFGPFLAQLDTTIVNIALPTLSAELNAPLATVQWVSSGYLLALALMIPLSGWLVDRVGAKRVLITVLICYTLASALCGLATSIEQLIASRVVQGMAGGLLAPMAQLMMARHAGSQMARMIALTSTPILVAPILGPSVAGAVLYFSSWHWLFLLNLPAGIAAVLLAVRFLPKDGAPKRRPLDWFGFLLVSPGLVMLLDGLHRFATTPADERFVPAGELAVAIFFLLAFVLRGWRLGDAGLIDLTLFKTRSFNAAAATQFLASANTQGGLMLFALYLLTLREFSPSMVGLIMAPIGIGVLCTRPIVHRIIRRYGPRWVSMSGGIVCLVASLPFLWPGLSLPAMAIGALLFARGLGTGNMNMPSMVSAYSGLPRSAVTHAATAINIFQRLGGPVATMVLALLLQAYSESQGSGAAVTGMGLTPMAFTVAFAALCLTNLLGILSASRIAKRM